MTEAGPKGGGNPIGRAPIEAVMAQAAALHGQGQLAAAAAAYRQVLRESPRLAAAHYNLAIALRALGEAREAVAAFRRALKCQPNYPLAHAGLAAALAALGKPEEALKAQMAACRQAPGERRHAIGLAALLRRQRFDRPNPLAQQALLLAFASPAVDGDDLVVPALDLVRRQPPLAELYGCLAGGRPAELAAAARKLVAAGRLQTLDRPLFRALMTAALVADPDTEQVLGALRRACLESPVAISTSAALGVVAAMACQCHLAEYAFAESGDERDRVAALRTAIGPAPVEDWGRLVMLALYQPWREIVPPVPGALAPPALQALYRRLVLEPAAEAAGQAAIPALTPVGGGISQMVREQYEQNPYPRWLSVRGGEAEPLEAVMGRLFPLAPVLPPPKPGTERNVLVAGCGTGKHAIRTARRFSGVRVLAVDLSRAALAYAQRKAAELGQENVRFAQADILYLGDLDERFDLIESVGVLHHMADPEAGWRVLTGLLSSRGVIKVGLYSAIARSHVAAARQHIADWKLSASAADIRAARVRLMALPADDPARAVVDELDFHSISNCRDLLFNVHEDPFTIPRLSQALQRLDLNFLGFEFWDQRVPQLYRQRFPVDRAMTDLDAWHRFETEQPRAFRGMYQFWCRPR